MPRITIKTNAYASNRNFLEIVEALHVKGFDVTPNVAIDGQVSIDTNAPKADCLEIVKGRSKSVWIAS